jgi:hypothetical protein
MVVLTGDIMIRVLVTNLKTGEVFEYLAMNQASATELAWVFLQQDGMGVDFHEKDQTLPEFEKGRPIQNSV